MLAFLPPTALCARPCVAIAPPNGQGSETCDYPGQEKPISEVDVFDTRSGAWSTLPSPLPATGDLAAFVIGTTVYATGGYDETYNAKNSTFKIGELCTTSVTRVGLGDRQEALYNWTLSDLLALSFGELREENLRIRGFSGPRC